MAWQNLKEKFRDSFFHPRYIAHNEIKKIVAAEASVLSGMLLDIGCGKKPYAPLLTTVNKHIGLDVPTTMHGLSSVDVWGTGLVLPFRKACFDSILCTEVLEHTPNPLLTLSEIWRVTKPDGILLLTVPLSEQLHEEPYDYYRFTKYGLRYLLERTGWKIVKIYERGGLWLELGYRFSSFLYSTIGARRVPEGTFEVRPLLGPLTIIVCAFIQFVATGLDKIWHSSLSTIGYGIVAQKEILSKVKGS